ncbi:MAG: hypothetical protein M0T85_01705 [Dehalococcoidales bacterium]|nr:hypothetical protein [Dehalococcoidales bacterium]
MARQQPAQVTAQYLLGGAVLYITYSLALRGTFGSDLKTVAEGLRSNLKSSFGELAKGNKKSTNSNSGGSGSGSGSSGSGGSGGGDPYAFISGMQFVAQTPDGRFYVYWNGSLYSYFNTQSAAEAAYRALVEERALNGFYGT